MLSALEAKGLLHNGCETYLAQMTDKTLEIILDSVPILREFSNMFLNDVLGLLKNWELKFEIELLSGSTPTFVPLYKMRLAKSKEMKTQLQDLVDKVLTQPNLPLYGTPVLVVQKKDRITYLCIDFW